MVRRHGYVRLRKGTWVCLFRLPVEGEWIQGFQCLDFEDRSITF